MPVIKYELLDKAGNNFSNNTFVVSRSDTLDRTFAQHNQDLGATIDAIKTDNPNKHIRLLSNVSKFKFNIKDVMLSNYKNIKSLDAGDLQVESDIREAIVQKAREGAEKIANGTLTNASTPKLCTI